MRTAVLACVLAFAAVLPSITAAQSYPSKPIRVIVPAVGGSAVDVNMRRVAPKMAEGLGQPVIVENRPGGNSAIGAREVARAAPDGYTLLHGNVNNALNDLLTADSAKLTEAFTPITRIVTSPLVMVANPGLGAKTLKDYLASAKAQPGSLTFASGGTGAITQLLGELVKITAGINVREVPYKSIGAEMPDLLAGHVGIAYLAPSVIAQHVKSGKLIGLAVAGPRRVSIIPDVPTMTEAGLPGVEGLGWNGLFAPAGTPAAIIERLRDEVAKAMASPQIRDEAIGFGQDVGGESPAEFGAFVRAEIAKWGKVIKDAGIKVE